MSDKVRYLLLGLLLGIGVIFLMAQATSGGSAGSFQVAAGGNFYVVLDTRSGKVVEIKGDYVKQSVAVSGVPTMTSSSGSGYFPSDLNVKLNGSISAYVSGVSFPSSISVSGVYVPSDIDVDVSGSIDSY